jgi:hypothetical protein
LIYERYLLYVPFQRLCGSSLCIVVKETKDYNVVSKAKYRFAAENDSSDLTKDD